MKHRVKKYLASHILVLWFLNLVFMAPLQAQTNPVVTDEEITVLLQIFNDHINKRVQPNGVCLYSEPNYEGERICFTDSQALLNSGWDNKASSVGISATYVAVLYPNANFAGGDLYLLEDTADLGSMNNITSSLSVALYDGDNDGIPYGVDQCLGTGSNQTVNAVGCSDHQLDDDNDGASNAVDVCSNTPSGEPADIQGCSASQDSDNDGIANDQDPYPHQSVSQCYP